MRVQYVKNGYLVLTGSGPRYVHRTGGGGGLCHWSFLPELVRDVELDPLHDEVKSELRRLTAERRDLVACKTMDELPDVSQYFHPDRQPFRYQVRGIEFARRAKRAIIADDTGIGKTIQTIGVVLAGFDDESVRRAVILTPATVKYQWREQFLYFTNPSFFPEMDSEIVVVDGTKAERRRLYRNPAGIFIMTYDVFRRDCELPEFEKMMAETDLVAADEASAIRNRGSKISKALKTYAKTTYRLPLTATPIENRLHDLFSISEWVDRSIFPSMEWFDAQYCTYIPIKIWVHPRGKGRRKRKPFKKEIMKLKDYRNLDDAMKRLEHRYIRRTVADPEVDAELPDVVSSILEVSISKEQREAYNYVRDEIRMSDDENPVDVLAKIAGLRKTCAYYRQKKSGKIYSAKLDELKVILDRTDEKVVVFSEFKTFTDLMMPALKDYHPVVIDGSTPHQERQAAQLMFQDPDSSTRVLLATEAGERGVNLQRGSLLINMDLPYNPARLKQRIGRICRVGSDHQTVRVINMVAASTFESRVLEILQSKMRLFDAMFESDGIDRIGNPIESMSGAALKRLL